MRTAIGRTPFPAIGKTMPGGTSSVSVILLCVASAAVLLCGDASAHRYIPNEGDHSTFENAIAISDINVSQVGYHEVTPALPRLWFSFSATEGQELHVELGVPQIDRLREYRPALAVLGPGLPAIEVPFAIPEGYGGWLFPTDDTGEPEAFHEPFTGTDSWLFPTKDLVLPSAGAYYVVAFVPSEQPGKLWMAVGTAEQFTLKDIFSLLDVIYRVRTFHEVFPFGGILFWAFLAVAAVLTALVSGVLYALKSAFAG